MVVVELRTAVRCRPEVLFDLELDVEVHTASLVGERASSTRRHLRLGDEVTFTARHLGLTRRLTSRVTAYDRPVRFVDEQVSGPFAWMVHEHRFEGNGEQTVMTDRMEFALPWGALGQVVAAVVLRPYLTRLLSRRARHVAGLASGT